MKNWFLDTNTLAYAINRQGGVRERLNAAALDGVLLTGTIAIYELLYGAEMSRRRDENRRNIFNLIKRTKVEPFDFKAAEKMAGLQAHFEKKGKPRPRLDLMQAAQALSLGAVLVTTDSDLKVETIPGRKVQDWHEPPKTQIERQTQQRRASSPLGEIGTIAWSPRQNRGFASCRATL